MYNYGYNCYTPCVQQSSGCGGFAFILVLFILLAIICSCGGFGFGGNNSCGCKLNKQANYKEIFLRRSLFSFIK